MTPLQLARALEPILGLRWTIETHRDGGVRAEGRGGLVLFTRGRRVELGARVGQAWRVAAIPAIPALVSRWLDEGRR